MLKLEHISAGYGKKKVLDDVSAEFKKGVITVVMVPQGSRVFKNMSVKGILKSQRIFGRHATILKPSLSAF